MPGCEDFRGWYLIDMTPDIENAHFSRPPEVPHISKRSIEEKSSMEC
jgi:hypothetical protein